LPFPAPKNRKRFAPFPVCPRTAIIRVLLYELWSYAESVAREERENNEPDSFEKIDQQSVLKTIESIDKALKGTQVDKKVKQKLNYARKNWSENLKKYEQQEKTLGNRNYRKFLLRGIEKVETEVGLLALSHNLSKIAARN